jgi:hypothetical protein
VLELAVLPEAREVIVEALEPVLQRLVHPLDEVLPLVAIDVMLQPRPPARLGIPRRISFSLASIIALGR